MSILQNLIRVGTVSSAKPTSGTVRVVFPDRDDLVSAELPVLISGGWGKGNAFPLVGESVLCLFLGNGLQAGYCLGIFYGDEDVVPGTNDQRGVWFEDGSYVYYDRAAGCLVVKAATGVKIEGDLVVTGTITHGGGMP